MSAVYRINKGINKPVEFKGLKAQYIWWLGGGVIGLLVLFAILYIIGVNAFVCVAIIFSLGAAWVVYVYGISKKYGEHGMMKKIAWRSVPRVIKVKDRKAFYRGKRHS